jgi:hypothetical protein
MAIQPEVYMLTKYEDLQPWQVRVIDELEQLTDRLSKLTKMLGSEEAIHISPEDVELLQSQACTMLDLQFILHRRVRRFYEPAVK